MNNLLRTLTESQVKPAADLRLLLNTVKETRKQSPDAKLWDAFYESLDGLLNDLKTITIDNRDAEAFLRPVPKSEVPDYLDVISNPMDFATMTKKVKQRQYKSKREFKDDLDLIWSNCFTYNASENHPLRQCVKRLKVKAERLLKHITDRKERQDPPIPSDLPSSGVARPRMNGANGHINGHASHTRSPSITIMPKLSSSASYSKAFPKTRGDTTFSDSPAIIRTPEGMGLFRDLETQVGAPVPQSTLAHTLRELAPTMSSESESDDDAMVVDGVVGEKRKVYVTELPHLAHIAELSQKRYFGSTATETRAIHFLIPNPLADEMDDISQLWWGAVQSDELLANGLPGIPFGPSCSISHRKKLKRRKPKKAQPLPTPNPKSILSMMNNNIKTMRRLRHTHSRFTALSAASAPQEEEEGVDGTSMFAGPSTVAAGAKASVGHSFGSVPPFDEDALDDKIDERPWTLGRGQVETHLRGLEIGEANGKDCLNWATEKVLEHVGFQGTSKVALEVLADVAAQYMMNVGRTIRFLTDKFGKTMTPEEIILHTLFESGGSKVQDLERFVSDDIERYGARLGELEKKLVSAYRETSAGELLEDEGLFEESDGEEAGVLAMGDFADALGEDYLGLRELGIASELGLQALTIPKKLLRSRKGQNQPSAAKPSEPPPPFPPPPPFVPLTAGDVEDQIGLLKPLYTNRFAIVNAAHQATLVPPPLPGPSLSLPSLSGPILPPPLTGPSLAPALSTPSANWALPSTNSIQPQPQATHLSDPQTLSASGPGTVPPPSPDLVLPDDAPNPAQMKMSPVGAITTRSTGATSSSKKKAAAAAAAARAADTSGAGVGGSSANRSGQAFAPVGVVAPVVSTMGVGQTPGMSPAPMSLYGTPTPMPGMPGAPPPGGSGAASSNNKKKKGNTGVGTGNGRKKKDGSGPSGGAGGGGGGPVFAGQGGASFPAVVIASA